MEQAKVIILGASGYTGAEAVRLIASHPKLKITGLTADRRAGERMGAVFPHLDALELPTMQRIEDVNFADYDAAICALPHATTQAVVAELPESIKVSDISADFRLEDPAIYEEWYGTPHIALERQKTAVYGLTEFYRDQVKATSLVANPGCYPTSALLPLLPLLEADLIDPDTITIDAKSGVSGAGRAPAEGKLHTETSEGFHAYGVGKHRHMPEMEQELSKKAGKAVTISFTPHLVPMNRGMLATIYVQGDADAIHNALATRYADEPFVHVLEAGQTPQTRHVRGSNQLRVGVVKDRIAGRTILISVIDNLVKGASGQAIQNLNLMLGFDETEGLMGQPMFP